MEHEIHWARVLSDLPLIPILRGIEPDEAVEIAGVLHEAGFLCLEVPLNSPNPLQSVERIRRHFDGDLLIGAGTVLSVSDVARVKDAGGAIVVSPNTDPDVIEATKQRDMVSLPGFATATEAFRALGAGADALKLFPAEIAPPAVLSAFKTVLPPTCAVFPVGGITPANMEGYRVAGATGFGIGSAIYKRGMMPAAVAKRAEGFISVWRAISKSGEAAS